METIHLDGSPLAAYLEGEGQLDRTPSEVSQPTIDPTNTAAEVSQVPFAPTLSSYTPLLKGLPPPRSIAPRPESSIRQLHNAWSTALNSRLGRVENARFLEHFRYIVVASQLLNEYLDQGSLPPPSAPLSSLDGAQDVNAIPTATISLLGAAVTATAAFALVYIINWARKSQDGSISKSRIFLALFVFTLAICMAYGYVRRQWLHFLRRNAVIEITALTTNWQSFEVSASSALSLIQEVELVSRGYKLSAPLPPASRLEDQAMTRRCIRLRQSLHKAYSALIPACNGAYTSLRSLAREDDLDRYFEVYDISINDVRDALDLDALASLESDPESLKSLRVWASRAGVLRRIVLCSFMALEADGGKPDFSRWRLATEAMKDVSQAVAASAARVQQSLKDIESIAIPMSPPTTKPHNSAAKDKLRGQVRKISMLSSGIKTLQAKMQVLREESNRSIEQSEDLADLGPSLMSQYESIGADLKELMQAWEAGKASLQSNLTKQEHRISLASSPRSVVSSFSGMTAVDEDGGPAAALRALTGDSKSNRSSMGTMTSDEEVFEAVALPRQRSPLTREERIAKMHEEREKQAIFRAKRDANTSMLRELESVINLRPKKDGGPRITSV